MSRKPTVYSNRLMLERMSVERPTPKFYGYEARFAEWATSQGWDVTKRGWPDFICRRDGALMAVEVKGGADDLSPEQIDALDDLSAAGLPTYVYHHGLGLKRWRSRKVESVASLKAEISELHELVRKVVQVRDGMVPGIHKPRSPEWSFQDELDAVIRWCGETHTSHACEGTRMTHCSWLYFLREHEHQEWEDIRTVIGGFPAQLKGLHVKVCKAVEDARNRYAEAAAA